MAKETAIPLALKNELLFLRGLIYEDLALLFSHITSAEDITILTQPITGIQYPIHLAAKRGLLTAVKMIFTKNPNLINITDTDGQTALIWAAINGHTHIVRYLIAQNAELNHATTILYEDGTEHFTHGRTALHWAIIYGHIDIVISLLNAGAEMTRLDGMHLVHIAAQSGHLNIVELFIEHNPTLLNEKDEYQQTALIWAAANGHTHIVQYLISKNAELNHASERIEEDGTAHEAHGKTALLWALTQKYPATARHLLTAGAIATTINEGIHPIHIAAQNGYFDIVQYLVTRNPELINLKSDNGYTPLMWTMSHDLPKHDRLDIASFLSEGVLGDTSLTTDGMHPIHIAAKRGYTGIVRRLLAHNPELINFKSDNGYTPLMWAASRDHIKTLNFLIKKGANLDACSTTGYTAMQLAAERNFYKTVEALKTAGAIKCTLWLQDDKATRLTWKANADSKKFFDTPDDTNHSPLSAR